MRLCIRTLRCILGRGSRPKHYVQRTTVKKKMTRVIGQHCVGVRLRIVHAIVFSLSQTTLHLYGVSPSITNAFSTHHTFHCQTHKFLVHKLRYKYCRRHYRNSVAVSQWIYSLVPHQARDIVEIDNRINSNALSYENRSNIFSFKSPELLYFSFNFCQSKFKYKPICV